MTVHVCNIWFHGQLKVSYTTSTYSYFILISYPKDHQIYKLLVHLTIVLRHKINPVHLSDIFATNMSWYLNDYSGEMWIINDRPVSNTCFPWVEVRLMMEGYTCYLPLNIDQLEKQWNWALRLYKLGGNKCSIASSIRPGSSMVLKGLLITKSHVLWHLLRELIRIKTNIKQTLVDLFSVPFIIISLLCSNLTSSFIRILKTWVSSSNDTPNYSVSYLT